MRPLLAALWSSSSLALSDALWQPQQVSLAAGAQAESQVSITWLTADPRDDAASCSDAAVVEVSGPVSTSPRLAAPILRFTGQCLRYSFGSAPELHGNYTSGRIHRVRIVDLVPGSNYSYRLAGDPSTIRRFRTLPASLPPASQWGVDRRFPIVFGVVGDLGQTADSEETVRHLEADDTLQMILHPGDMPYADTDGARWDRYGHMVEPLSSRLQWMVCPGNHEIESDFYTGENFVPYEARFAMPAIQPAQAAPSPEQVGCKHPWPFYPHSGNDCTPSIFQCKYDWGNSFYAFDAGPARVISLNSYTGTKPGSPQHTWLKAELEALQHRRAETPWLIVMMHCPLYSSNTAHVGEMQAVLMRDAHGFEDLFHEHKVAVVLSGHVHAYERSRPVYRNESVQGGPTYIVVGDGGNREGHADRYQLPRPSWSAFRKGNAYGHGRLVLVNKTHMRWEWLRNDAAQPPALDARAAAKRADELEKAGAHAAAGESSAWRSPLAARTADDFVWITNPYETPHPAPSAAAPNASIISVGLAALAVVVAVLITLLVRRCRLRPSARLLAPEGQGQGQDAAELQERQ